MQWNKKDIITCSITYEQKFVEKNYGETSVSQKNENIGSRMGQAGKAFFKKSKSLTKSPLHLGYVKFFCQEVLISFWFLCDTKRFDLIYGTIILRKNKHVKNLCHLSFFVFHSRAFLRCRVCHKQQSFFGENLKNPALLLITNI